MADAKEEKYNCLNVKEDVSKYDQSIMNIYLCLHSLCCQLSLIWRERHLSLMTCLCRLRNPWITLTNCCQVKNIDTIKLKGYYAANQWPLTFDYLFYELNVQKLSILPQQGSTLTVLDHITKLLKFMKIK